MRFKKGFTLAELLVVLMVIGVLAAITVPTMVKGVQEGQMKASYKKGYNTIANMFAAAMAEGKAPKTRGQISDAIAILAKSLSVKGFYNQSANAGWTAGTYSTGACTSLGYVGAGSSSGVFAISGSNNSGGWVIADDGIAYAVIDGGSSSCATVAEINDHYGPSSALASTCGAYIVDVNGLMKGPNLINPSGCTTNGTDYSFDQKGFLGLNIDRIYVFIGSDGVTAGRGTIGGKILE